MVSVRVLGPLEVRHGAALVDIGSPRPVTAVDATLFQDLFARARSVRADGDLPTARELVGNAPALCTARAGHRVSQLTGEHHAAEDRSAAHTARVPGISIGAVTSTSSRALGTPCQLAAPTSKRPT